VTRVALKGLLGRKLRASLTAIAVVLGVAMISGTYILTDTIKGAFSTVFTRAFQHADAVITHIRYPYLYGPRQLAPREWSIIRRIRDGRTSIPVIDGGLTLESRAYADNAAHAVLLAVDQPDKSAGRTYHVADEATPTDAERALEIAPKVVEKLRRLSSLTPASTQPVLESLS